MTTKKFPTIFLNSFFHKIQWLPKPLLFEKYQHLLKALLAQSSPFVVFYHRLKYLHNFQNHPVYIKRQKWNKGDIFLSAEFCEGNSEMLFDNFHFSIPSLYAKNIIQF
jgi:hypothetical protein